MAQSIWEILGIEPTKDKKLIKKAFASKSKLIHPEENQEEFMKLNDAYKRAISLADNTQSRIPSANTDYFERPNLVDEKRQKTLIDFDEIEIKEPIKKDEKLESAINFDDIDFNEHINQEEYIAYLEQNIYLLTYNNLHSDNTTWDKILDSIEFNSFISSSDNLTLFLDMLIKYSNYIDITPNILRFLEKIESENNNTTITKKLDLIFYNKTIRKDTPISKKSQKEASKIYSNSTNNKVKKKKSLTGKIILITLMMINIMILSSYFSLYSESHSVLKDLVTPDFALKSSLYTHISLLIIFPLFAFCVVKTIKSKNPNQRPGLYLAYLTMVFIIIQCIIMIGSCVTIAHYNDITLSLFKPNILFFIVVYGFIIILALFFALICHSYYTKKRKNVI